MKIFYRGYVIHRPIPDFDSTIYGCLPDSTIYGCLPDRSELTLCTSNREAMQWVDRYIQVKENPRPSIWAQLATL